METSIIKLIRAARARPFNAGGYVTLMLAFIISAGMLVGFSAPEAVAAPFQKAISREPSEQEVDQMLSIAEAQFEIVKILIKQGRFDRVVPEMKKIYDLNLPEKYEQATAESASLAANLLIANRQFDLAHQVLDEGYRHMRLNENKAALLKVNALVYKSEGNLDKAIELFARSVELERQSVHP